MGEGEGQGIEGRGGRSGGVHVVVMQACNLGEGDP